MTQHTGLMPGREDDQLGLAAAHAHNGADYKQHMMTQGVRFENMEVAVELTYRAGSRSTEHHPATDPCGLSPIGE